MSLFDGLEIYVAVREEGSFTAAAERLRLSKSYVSETVKALETRLGVRLLDRTTRSLRPTEAGEAYYGRAVRALAEAASARTEAQHHQAEPVGRLRVAVFDGFHRFLPLECLTPFFEAHPSLQIEFVESATAVNLIDSGVDLAIRITPSPEEQLIVRRLGISRVVAVASPGYLARHGAPRHPSELAQHRVVAYAPLFYAREWRFTVEGRPLTVPVQPVLLTHSNETLLQAAQAGIGITALPEWNIPGRIENGDLQRVLAPFPLPEAGIYAVYASNRLMTPKVKLFVDHIIRHLPATATAP